MECYQYSIYNQLSIFLVSLPTEKLECVYQLNVTDVNNCLEVQSVSLQELQSSRVISKQTCMDYKPHIFRILE